MHTFYLDASFVDDEKSGKHLSDEFLNGRNNQDIILQTQKENHDCCSKEVLKFGSCLKLYREQARDHKAREYSQSPQRRDRCLVNLPFVWNVEQLFSFSHCDNNRDC